MVRSLLGLKGVDYTVGDDPEVVKANARYRLALLILGAIIALAAVAAAVVVSIGVIRLNHVADLGVEQRDLIVSCTSPEGECAQAQQKQTGKLITKLIKSNKRIDQRDTDRVLHAIRTIFPRAAAQ